MLDFLFNINPMDILQVGIGDYIPGWDWLMEKSGLADQYNNTGSAINSFMVDLCNDNLVQYGVKMSEKLIGAARHLGAIFAICVAAGQAYKVMAGGDKFDVLNIMRPLIFAFILTMWPAVCTTLMMPARYIETYMRDQYVAVAKDMDDLRKKRFDKAYEVNKYVMKAKFNAEKVEESSKGMLGRMWDNAKDAFNLMNNLGSTAMNFIRIWILSLVESVIQALGEMIFSISVYIVFLTKALYLTVLMMFGPVWMVCSILDIWKDSWSQWVGRMVTVSMYGAVAYLVMLFSCCIITMTLQADIDKLDYILKNPAEGMYGYMKGMVGTTIMTFVGYMVGALAMGQVHELASFTFPGAGPLMGAGNFASGMKSYAMKYTGTKAVFSK